MPAPGPDQRDRSRNRRPRRRPPVGGGGRAPVTEYEEQQELEAARERNDLEVGDLREMSVAELRQVSRELELETAPAERKDDLVDQILRGQTERAGHDYASGILDIVDEGFGFMRRHGLLPSPDDVYVSSSQVRRFGLRIGDRVAGAVRAPREAEKYWGMLRVDSVNGVDTETARRRPIFDDLTPVHPDVLINLETDPKNLSQRLINLVNPIGKGQRALIVSPPKAGKTMLLKQIANGVSANYPEILLMVALIGERPEEVTDMRRSVKGEVISSTFDEPTENHTHVAEMALEIAKRQVETGRDVVILLDSITRLARAYNLALPPSGRTLSGGLDPIALYPPKRFFGAARNIEEGGSLTIIGTCLVDTGSRMDDVIYEEFKGTGNSELILDRKLAEKRIFPSIDVQRSGTRREELLLEEGTLKMVWTMRRMLSAVGANEGIEILLNRLAKTAVERRVPLHADQEPRRLTRGGRSARCARLSTHVWYGSRRCRKPVVTRASAAKRDPQLDTATPDGLLPRPCPPARPQRALRPSTRQETVLLNASVGVQRVLGRLRRPRATAASSDHDPPGPESRPRPRAGPPRRAVVGGGIQARTSPRGSPVDGRAVRAAGSIAARLLGRLGPDRASSRIAVAGILLGASVVERLGRAVRPATGGPRGRPAHRRGSRSAAAPAGLGGTDRRTGTRRRVGGHGRDIDQVARTADRSSSTRPPARRRRAASDAAPVAGRRGRGPVPRGRHAAQAGRRRHDRRRTAGASSETYKVKSGDTLDRDRVQGSASR